MYNGTLDTSDVLLNRGLNGAYGVGALSNGNFAGDGSAVKEGVRGNRDITLLESINRTGMDRELSSQINTGNQFLTDRINQQFLTDRFSVLERLTLENKASQEREFRALDVKITECCCKLEAGQAAIQAKLDAQQLQSAQAENQRLHMELAMAQRSPGNSGN